MPHHRRSPGRERRLLLYLCAIAVPSVALLYLSWQPIERQRDAMASLTLSNARLAAERMAAQVETGLLTLADACLKDGRVAEFVRLARSDDSMTTRDQARRLASTLVSEHPVASHMFVVDRAGPRYPPVHAPLPRSLNTDPSVGGVVAAFVRRFQEAEHLELREERLARAFEEYRRCTLLGVPNEFKALALARMARVSTRLGRPQDARATWVSLASAHADDRDLVNQPFGVIAALELAQLEPGQHELQSLVVDSYQHFVNGRWTLSADEADYFRVRYSEALGREELAPTTRFLEEHRLARALSRNCSTPVQAGWRQP